MSYPFYCLAATRLTASQHPCRLSIAAAAVAAPFLLINPALAALNCTEQPTCSELGYKKTLEANCEDYILCPFDTNYKACVKEGCGDGFAKDVSGCGKSGDKGWLLTKTNGDECGICSAKLCQTPSKPGNINCQSGYYAVETGKYQGDIPCFACTKIICGSGMALQASDCGTTGEQGWELDLSALGTSNGCRKCKAKSCPTGYSPENTGGTSVACFPNYVMLYNGYSGNNRCYKCQKCPTGYATQDSHCEDGYAVNKSIPHSTYAGCYKCEMKSCSSGYARSADACGTSGSKGWTLGTETDTAGCKKCKALGCPIGTQTGKSCVTGTAAKTDYYAGNNVCYQCVDKTECPKGYKPTNVLCMGDQQETIHPDKKDCHKCETCLYPESKYKCPPEGPNKKSETWKLLNGTDIQCIVACTDRFGVGHTPIKR